MKPNSVDLVAGHDEWVVVVIEQGEELQRSFKIESHAQSWCDGQRMRLGLMNGMTMSGLAMAAD